MPIKSNYASKKSKNLKPKSKVNHSNTKKKKDYKMTHPHPHLSSNVNPCF